MNQTSISAGTASRIRVLPVSLANKIAAGEVVERPASVVKELIENAIDAEAVHIDVVLKQSGKELIQVVDDGTGMSPEDLKMAFKRHATSKISTVADLEKIETLGFRGEALPSIASVSRVEIKSRQSDEKLGHVLYLESGNIVSDKRTAGPAGTNISVKNLFYNTPARRNFLKSDSAELQQILTVLKRFFLAHPEIDFQIFSNDTELFHLSAGDIEQRIRDVFGSEVFNGLIPMNESLGGIELSGFISRPDKVRRNRNNQFLFLNGRPIQDRSLQHAVLQGYGNLIEHGTYPTYCLFLEMDTHLVDVNVHPTKMEVRFTNDRSLYYFFMSSIRKIFNEVKVIPKMGEQGSDAFLARFQDQAPTDIATELKSRKRYMSRQGGGSQLSLAYFTPKEDATDASGMTEKGAAADVDVQFWQIHQRYILSEIKSGMVIIDQHVAHERILYEKIRKVLRNQEQSVGQHLLFPQTITLAMDDFLVFREMMPLLQKIGFGIKSFSGTTVVADAIPTDVKVGRETQVILDIIDYYKEGEDKNFEPYDRMAAAFACKNAIKSGESLSQAQMHAIVDQLFACESPYFCPHGRPVIVTIDLDELDRKFKRIK
jgi:DNA mismatch repair protein MutL